jgi:AcrR family transcriptional regulator
MRERIVEVAARAIRRTGYGGTGVADIMKDAGLTHGGFYAHFASREANAGRGRRPRRCQSRVRDGAHRRRGAAGAGAAVRGELCAAPY